MICPIPEALPQSQTCCQPGIVQRSELGRWYSSSRDKLTSNWSRATSRLSHLGGCGIDLGSNPNHSHPPLGSCVCKSPSSSLGVTLFRHSFCARYCWLGIPVRYDRIWDAYLMLAEHCRQCRLDCQHASTSPSRPSC